MSSAKPGYQRDFLTPALYIIFGMVFASRHPKSAGSGQSSNQSEASYL